MSSNLQKMRKSAKMSQAQLSALSGVNVRMIQYYEQGVKDINAAAVMTVYKLALALGCSIEDLIEKDEVVLDKPVSEF